MMDEARSITVTILGREYQIACPPEEQERLLECADYLNGRMNAIRKRGRSMGIERIAIMAALNIARDFLDHRDQGPSGDVDDSTRRRLRQMELSIDQALSERNS
ncbi:cell division protein ZapA [Abyssibacter profundi]|uniref:Cell division protein ZapA n=1 Tax=Abyssibacter profundi TaxID=2182787 RepID=A0A363UNU9_9GAMM|nr:cell division protein ZapA [Abyssibacter profundi]MBV60196.1 cell division protein ZapA [Nevskiales bacterium]PWN57113.1 cell division protein ZapA [Abyssibacter profundi]